MKEAAELAQLVPEPLREAAFNPAFEQLIAESEVPVRSTRSSSTGKTSAKRRGASTTPRTTTEAEETATVLISSLSRTDHPEIGTASKALDRALHLLRIANTEHDIDGMTAPQIAKVLTDKFRQRVSRQAINQALDAAGTYVDRTPTSSGVVYRLMGPGEVPRQRRGRGCEPAATQTGRGPTEARARIQGARDRSAGYDATTKRWCCQDDA
jgi:hypothetical protein